MLPASAYGGIAFDKTPDDKVPCGFNCRLAHLKTDAEFDDLFAGEFDRIALWGLESFTSPAQEKLAHLSEEDREAWLDIVEQTAAFSESLGYSDHFLYVGSRGRG